MSLVIIMFIIFFIIIFLGMPIAFALIFAPLIYLLLQGDISLSLVAIKLFRSTDSFIFLSVPFFILAGSIMNESGITGKLITFSDLMVGHLKGGLAHINIVASMFFGGCTGSAISDTVAIGSILIPGMVERGYEKDFSAGVTAASSTMGPIIPPSITFILYAGVSNVSIRDLFVAGIIPGILIGLGQMLMVSLYAHKRNYPKRTKKIPISEGLLIVRDATWGLLLPIIILGGIMSGFFTPTEAAVVAVFYALFVSFCIYKSINLSKLLKIIANAGVESGAVMLLVASASLFSWVLSNEQIPLKVAQGILNITSSPWQALIIINVALLIVGMFIDSTPAILFVTPVLLPLYSSIGLDPIQAGLITCVNLITGLSTPPVGCCLFAASTIAEESFYKVSIATLPFLLVNIIVLLLITYIPVVTTFLPKILF